MIAAIFAVTVPINGIHFSGFNNSLNALLKAASALASLGSSDVVEATFAVTGTAELTAEFAVTYAMEVRVGENHPTGDRRPA